MEIYNICLGTIYFNNIPPTIFKRRAGFTMQTTTLKAVNSKERLGCDSINAEILLKLIIMPNEDLSEYDKRVKARCCNLPLLESIL